MINLGVGVKRTADSTQNVIGMQNEDEVDAVENGDGDLLDKVERHINSAAGRDGMDGGNGQNSKEDIQMQNGQEDNPDISVLNTIVEEMYERFNDADINQILQICGEVLCGHETTTDEARAQDG